MKTLALLAVLFAVALAPPAMSQDIPKHEFRGAWIATVTNLDWPKTTNVEAQQAALVRMLDQFKATGINAVFFQIRPEADALYDSDIEPWSRWLTGQQGRAPNPYYDPLTFAIEEAHKRGLELHAWFNPYRLQRQVGSYTLDPQHIAVRHPEWTFTVNTYQQLDPGLPQVRDYVLEVIMDVVRRYDIDGVHFDDYFYPYPPNQITNQDDATFAEHHRGFTNRGDWRRDNVNLLVRMVHDSLQTVRPEIKFGISPFGIWRNGVPNGIIGLDAYNVIFADAVAWHQEQIIDYNIPQLYWGFGGGQDFATLAPWWESVRNDRHLYPGLGLYKADSRTFSGTLYTADVVPRQVRFNREYEGIEGSVFFRAQNITDFNSLGIRDTLQNDLYRYPALTPVMDWKDTTPPPAPESFGYEWHGEVVTLHWNPVVATPGEADARFYAVYRVQSAEEPDFAAAMADPANLLTVTGQTYVVDWPSVADEPYYYVVTSVSHNSIESVPTGAIMLEGRATSVETTEPIAFRLEQNYPNPFRSSTRIGFALEHGGHVSLRVYDVLGRMVATIIDDVLPADAYTVEVEAGDMAAGTYLYVLERDGQRLGSNQMQVVR
jgi:uncharacterized lipoprotein YddW (UPF0748 family)